jgi:hypothetical protein
LLTFPRIEKKEEDVINEAISLLSSLCKEVVKSVDSNWTRFTNILIAGKVIVYQS